ncbi:hypothetical protein C8R43DRAFT_958839 [Mycena crocata]|nr:hypothetical protein C8R43DRAFT_958839 [Mycena crocata]
MSGIFIIVDDQDPHLEFSTPWGPTAAGNDFEYGGTITGPGPQGSTATYQFSGTSISVFGMIGRNANKSNTTLTFVIDAGAFVNSTVILTDGNEHFHRRFFASPSLVDGSHTLDITLTAVNSRDVFLDYLIYEASPNSTVGTAQLLILNTNPFLTYSAGWSNGLTGLRPGLVQTAVSLNNSVEGAAQLGATVAFNFTGSYSVRGLMVKPSSSPVATYSLDGAPWMDVQMPPAGISFTNAVSNFGFIGRTFRTAGTHSLVISPLIPGAFFLDYIIVQSPTASLPAKAAVAAPPSLASGSGSVQPVSTSSTPSPTNSGTSKGASLSGGAIGGVVLGITAFIGILVFAWILLRRRSTREHEGNATSSSGAATRRSDAEMTHTDVTPYTMLSAPTVSSSSAVPRTANTSDRPEDDDPATLPPAYIDRPRVRIGKNGREVARVDEGVAG